MATFKGVVFQNRQAFEGTQTAVFNFYKAKYNEIGVTSKWSKGIDSTDSNEVLMVIDERVLDFPWSPHAIVDVDTTDPKWFNQNGEI